MIAVALAVCAGCGGDDDNGNGGNGGGVRNGSRLAWSQMAFSATQVQLMTFRIYVDGAPMSLSNTSCGTQSTAAGYDCSGVLPTMAPGRRVIELASIYSGRESARSAPLTITITASSTQSLAPESLAPPDAGEDPSSASSTVCVANSRECYSTRAIASEVKNPYALSPLMDGRLLFIENGTAVRVIEGDVLLAQPALLPPERGARIVGLGVDKTPEGKGTVFVAWAEDTSSGPRLNLTRYREVHNALGEGATIVTGLPFTDHAMAPLAVDGNGLVYLAMPGSGTGQILRFTRTGATPEDNPRSSPIIAEGYSRPIGMAIDSTRNRIWLAGDQPWSFQLAMLHVTGGSQSSWPLRPRSPAGSPPAIIPTSLNLVTSTTPDGESWLIVGAGGQLLGGTTTADGSIEGFAPLEFEPSLSAQSAAQGPLNSLYVVAGSNTTSTSILRLIPR